MAYKVYWDRSMGYCVLGDVRTDFVDYADDRKDFLLDLRALLELCDIGYTNMI